MLTGSSKWRRSMEKSIGVDAARKLSYRDYENHIQESIAALKAEGDPCQVLIATDVCVDAGEEDDEKVNEDKEEENKKEGANDNDDDKEEEEEEEEPLKNC